MGLWMSVLTSISSRVEFPICQSTNSPIGLLFHQLTVRSQYADCDLFEWRGRLINQSDTKCQNFVEKWMVNALSVAYLDEVAGIMRDFSILWVEWMIWN